MKKQHLRFLSCVALFALGVTSCSVTPSGGGDDSDLEKKQREIYQLAVTSGYEGTYEEWLNSIRGENGSMILFGEGAPSSNIGKAGDAYLNTTSWDVFVKLGNVWNKVGNIMGPRGEQGQQGEQGPQGPQGEQGLPGQDGVSVVKTEVDENGYLIIHYSDGTSENAGKVLKTDAEKYEEVIADFAGSYEFESLIQREYNYDYNREYQVQYNVGDLYNGTVLDGDILNIIFDGTNMTALFKISDDYGERYDGYLNYMYQMYNAHFKRVEYYFEFYVETLSQRSTVSGRGYYEDGVKKISGINYSSGMYSTNYVLRNVEKCGLLNTENLSKKVNVSFDNGDYDPIPSQEVGFASYVTQPEIAIPAGIRLEYYSLSKEENSRSWGFGYCVPLKDLTLYPIYRNIIYDIYVNRYNCSVRLYKEVELDYDSSSISGTYGEIVHLELSYTYSDYFWWGWYIQDNRISKEQTLDIVLGDPTYFANSSYLQIRAIADYEPCDLDVLGRYDVSISLNDSYYNYYSQQALQRAARSFFEETGIYLSLSIYNGYNNNDEQYDINLLSNYNLNDLSYVDIITKDLSTSYSATSLSSVKADKGVYGYPFLNEYSGNILFYNKQYFSSNQLYSLDEMIKYCEDNSLAFYTGGYQPFAMNFLLGSGCKNDYFVDDSGVLTIDNTFTSGKGYAAASEISRINNSFVRCQGTPYYDNFGFVIASNSNYRSLLNRYGDSVGVAVLPSFNSLGKTYKLSNPASYSFFAVSKVEGEAKQSALHQFAEYLSHSSDFMSSILSSSSQSWCVCPASLTIRNELIDPDRTTYADYYKAVFDQDNNDKAQGYIPDSAQDLIYNLSSSLSYITNYVDAKNVLYQFRKDLVDYCLDGDSSRLLNKTDIYNIIFDASDLLTWSPTPFSFSIHAWNSVGNIHQWDTVYERMALVRDSIYEIVIETSNPLTGLVFYFKQHLDNTDKTLQTIDLIGQYDCTKFYEVHCSRDWVDTKLDASITMMN